MSLLVVCGCFRVGDGLRAELLALRWYFRLYLGLRAFEVSAFPAEMPMRFVFRKADCF